MDFFARQEAARRATRWILLVFLISVVLVALAIGLVVGFVASQVGENREAGTGLGVMAGVAALLVVSGASLFKTLSLRAGGGVVARSLGGTRVARGSRDLALQRLHNVVEEMAIASGVSMPELYVLENEEGINAFAAGNTPADAAIAVTRGALTRLNREELQGVIAHEYSHVLNGDMRLNSRLLGWVFGLLVVAIAMRLFLESGAARSRRRDDKSGALVMIALAIMLIGYIGVFVGRLLQAAVSRNRERLADASAVQFTRNPTGLKGALLKIAGVSAGSRLVSPDKEEVAHMLFAPGMARLFATHPPIGERLRELDPGFQPEQLPALAAAAARDAERLRLAAPAESSARSAAPPLMTPAAMATAAAAAQVVALAGTFDEQQQRYAREAREGLPEPLREFTDSADDARVMLLAMLRSADAAVAQSQDAAIRQTYGDALLTRVLSVALPVAQSLRPALRLPVLQQLLPALRRMTAGEQEELHAVAGRIAQADARIDVFECCLALLLESTMRAALDGSDEHGSRSLQSSVVAVRGLFGVLAGQGAADTEAARRAYDAGIRHVFPGESLAYEASPAWQQTLREALAQLATLRPSAKRVLIEGLVRTVAHDRRLSVAEGELLRTVCAVLNCPLPPILST